MSNQTDKDGWVDDVPEFDPDEAQVQRNKEEREIYARIKHGEDQ